MQTVARPTSSGSGSGSGDLNLGSNDQSHSHSNSNGGGSNPHSYSTMFAAAKYKPSNNSPVTTNSGSSSGSRVGTPGSALGQSSQSSGSTTSGDNGARPVSAGSLNLSGQGATGNGSSQNPTAKEKDRGEDLSSVEQRLRIVKRGRSGSRDGEVTVLGSFPPPPPSASTSADRTPVPAVKPPCHAYPVFSNSTLTATEKEALQTLIIDVVDGTSFPDAI
jgi:hypothetical protein